MQKSASISLFVCELHTHTPSFRLKFPANCISYTFAKKLHLIRGELFPVRDCVFVCVESWKLKVCENIQYFIKINNVQQSLRSSSRNILSIFSVLSTVSSEARHHHSLIALCHCFCFLFPRHYKTWNAFPMRALVVCATPLKLEHDDFEQDSILADELWCRCHTVHLTW